MTATQWPAVGYETLPWRTRYPEALTARQRAALPATYESAIVPEIADLTLGFPGEQQAAEAVAVSEIARFDSAVGAALLPWTSLLLRSESSASSRIERLTSSARKVIEEEYFGGAGGNATAVVANGHAMREATSIDGPLDLDALLAVHRTLLEHVEPTIAGHLRTEPVWIGGADHAPVDALFVPPAHNRLEPALTDLLAFAARTDIPPLARIAVTHAHFETIHPFADGNGRTGRALIHLLLRRAGLIHSAPLPLSAVLLSDTAAYFETLDAYRTGDPLPVIDLVTRAAVAAADLGASAGAELQRIHDDWQRRVTGRAGTPDRALATLLIGQPVLDVASAAAGLDLNPQTARRALARLEDAGIVIGYQVARGRRAWRAPDVLDLMDRTTSSIRRTL